MGKKLLLFSIVIILIMGLNAVSGFHFNSQYNTNDFRETTEFRQTTEQRTGDFWNFESTKRTITEKTEVRKVTRIPIHFSSSFSRNSHVPFSNWRFKEPYVHSRFANAQNNDYYYKPRYDNSLRYYNWRW